MNVKLIAWLSIFFLCLLWSSVNPHDRPTWWLEVLPAMIGLALLVLTRHRFPLTPLLYVLILIHSIILMVGGHYTYAEVPIGDWLQSLTGGDRNNYDKLGHFAQGFCSGHHCAGSTASKSGYPNRSMAGLCCGFNMPGLQCFL